MVNFATKTDEMSQLAMEAKTNRAACEQLQIQTQRIIEYVARRHAARYGGDADDIVQDFAVVFQRYVDTYDSEKGQSWASFIQQRVRYFCQDFSRKAVNQPTCNFVSRNGRVVVNSSSINRPRSFDGKKLKTDHSELIESHYSNRREEFANINERIKNLRPTIRLVMLMYYFEGMTMKAIGKSLGLSESRISQIHSRSLQQLRKDTRV